jgi:hypothetical protein
MTKKMTAATVRRTAVIHMTGTPSSAVSIWAQLPENPQQMPPSAANTMPRSTWLSPAAGTFSAAFTSIALPLLSCAQSSRRF